MSDPINYEGNVCDEYGIHQVTEPQGRPNHCASIRHGMQAIQGGILSRGTELLVCDLSGQLQGHKYLIEEIVGAQDASDDDSDKFLDPLAPGNLHLEDEGYYGVRDLQDCDEGDCRVHLLVEDAICQEASPHYPQDLPRVVERWVVELVVVVVV